MYNRDVGTLLATFTVFAVALGAMALGVMLSGRKLSGSCGGMAAKEGFEAIGDCSCRRKEADLCASDEGNELLVYAEIGNPKRKDYFKSDRERPAAPSGELLEV